MASKSNSNNACVQYTKVPRFSVQDAFRAYYMDISQDGCRLALSGWNDKTNDTFIDLFVLPQDPGFQDLSLSTTSQPYFSKEFTKIQGSPWRLRFVCLLDDSVFVTCCFNTIESYDTKRGRLVNRRQFTGRARCMTTTRNRRVYVGLHRSDDVIVFDRRLNQINKIKLKGLKGDYPRDMAVNNYKLLIITSVGLNWRTLMYNINGGDIEYEFKPPNQHYSVAKTVTVSEEDGLLYILWSGGGKRVVCVYSLPGDHSPLSGCHLFLASFNVPDDSCKTRVNSNANRLFVVTRKTGEVYEYHTNDTINIATLLTLIELSITKDDCQKLINYFEVPAEAAKTIQGNDGSSTALLQHLRETGKISAVNISLLLTACIDQGISQVAQAWANYQKYVSNQKTLQKQSEDQRKLLSKKLTESENDRQKLNKTLKETQIEKEELAKKLAAEEEQREQINKKLRKSEDKRMQMGNQIKQADEEKRELKDRLKREEEEKKELTERLMVINEEHQQLITTLSTARTGKKKQISDKLTEANYEKQQLTERLEMTENEERQMKEIPEGKERQEKQLTNKLEMTEKEKKELISRPKESEDERQKLIGRLETTEERRRELGERMEAKVKEVQHVTSRLRMTEDENKKLTSKLKESDDERQQLTGRLETTEEEKSHLVTRLTTTENERQELSNRLSATEQKLQDIYNEDERMKRIAEDNRKELEGAKSNLRSAKDNLVQAQVKYARESMALQEVLQQTREALSKQAVTSVNYVEQVGTLPKENETSDVSQELIALAADFGRLMADVAEDLTLDHTLRLALLFQLPNSEKYMLRRISLIATPGITLLNFLKTRNIINMYDVTNLQKSLMHLHLYSTNSHYVVPYQEKIDPLQYEENRSTYLADWPDDKTESLKGSEISDSQECERAEQTEQPQNEGGADHLAETMGREENPRQRQDLQNIQIREPYIENKINDEGGTIVLMGVRLSIPEGALTGDHVIAVTVIRDPDVLLGGTPLRGRMTPLIKLEPEGLKLIKPARLIIPHAAVIPEPIRRSVIIFSGQPAQGESQKCKGHISWTEENSVEWNSKLEQEIISLDINKLSYVFVNLVIHEMEQKHMFRVVPFIDGILDAKDDIIITVCFCKDNDAEYQLLLDDYKSKLFLRSNMTFQVSRTLNEDSDGVFDLCLTMLSQRDSYCLSEGEKIKFVDIDHLCAASTVSLQFGLQRNQSGDDEMIDVKLEVSQGENNKITVIIQSKVKDILLSRDTQSLLNQELTRDLHRYEILKKTISNLLEKKHCEKLATVFELTQAERDAVLNDPNPGAELVKILDERELIMPDKMLGLYQALKASHLDKIGRHVLDYIDATKTENANDSKMTQENDTETSQAYKRGLQDKGSKLTRNTRILTNEGFKRLDVQRALKLSHGKLDLGRRLLLLANDEHERLPLLPGSNVYKEQYIDELGGELDIAGIHLLVPAGALNTGRIVSLSISTEAGINGPISKSSLRLTPLLNFGPANLILHKPVTMVIPHCAIITSDEKDLNVYSGIPHKDKSIKWNLERNYSNCSMNNNVLQVEIHKPCGLIGPHIPFQRQMMKHIGVIPIMKRPCSPTDELTLSLWFYNDGNLERETLVHEEVYNVNGIVLHDPVSFQVRTMGSTLPVSISSHTSQWNVNPKKVEVDVDSLWLLDRHKVTFYLQARGNIESLNFQIESRYGLTRKILFQLTIRIKVEDLYRLHQTTSPFQQVLPKFTMESFKEMLKKISEDIDAEQSIQLSNIFQLPEDVISSIETHRKPGNLLMEMLSEKYVISASNVSRLEYALTEIGNEHCAKLVRDFRRISPVVHATMSPGNVNLID